MSAVLHTESRRFRQIARPALRWASVPYWLAGACILWIFASMAPLLSSPGSDPVEMRTSESINSTLVAHPARANQRHGYVTVTGELTNAGTRTLKDVEAVVQCYDRANHLIATDSALLEMPKIAAGDISTYSVTVRSDTAITAYRVRFRTLQGDTLSSRHAP